MSKSDPDDEQVEFSLMCGCHCGCDAGMDIGDREQAEHEGWQEIERHDGHTWNYLGICPECMRTYPQ